MNLNPEGKQSILREALIQRNGRQQSMSLPLDYHSLELTGGLKGIKRVLKERECDRRKI